LTKVITLTSDFGLKDPYAAEMNAAILSICPTAQVVDITHLVDKFNIRAGAFMLATAAPYFPKGTIHVAVVDPGVGSQRRPIIVQTERSCFVGPDNGVLMLAAQAEGIEQMRHIESRRLMLTHVSNTFHGRDIFAPIAAHLANGVALEEFGPQITDAVNPDFAKVTKNKDSLSGEVLHVDDFGNIITNIHTRDVAAFKESWIQVQFPTHTVEMKVSRAYADVKPHEPVALIGSHSYLEIALNQDNAAEKFSIRTGDKIVLNRT
jgi:S-adenosyl-L-methionine hydrolase (adenosine-forming)